MRGVRKSNVRRHAAAELAFRIVEPHLHAEDQLHAFVREADAKLSELVTLVECWKRSWTTSRPRRIAECDHARYEWEAGAATLEDELKLLEREMKEMQTRMASLRRKWSGGSDKLVNERDFEEVAA